MKEWIGDKASHSTICGRLFRSKPDSGKIRGYLSWFYFRNKLLGREKKPRREGHGLSEKKKTCLHHCRCKRLEKHLRKGKKAAVAFSMKRPVPSSTSKDDHFRGAEARLASVVETELTPLEESLDDVKRNDLQEGGGLFTTTTVRDEDESLLYQKSNPIWL